MSPLVVALLILMMMFGMFCTGLLLLWLWYRSCRSHPSCGRCGYDVADSIGAVDRCPECGVEMETAGVLRPAPRKRILLGFGVLLVLLPISGCLGIVGMRGMAYRGQSATPPPALGPAPTLSDPPAATREQVPSESG